MATPGPKEAPLEGASACPGVYGKGAYPGYAGDLLVGPKTDASYNAHGVNGKKHPSCCYLHIRNCSPLKRMKRKIVIKVSAHCDRCRTKAMKLAAAADGVSSVALEGHYKDKLVVIGEGVDAVELTRILRKKVNYATLESVQEVKREPTPIPPCCPSRCEFYQVAYDPYPPSTCKIM